MPLYRFSASPAFPLRRSIGLHLLARVLMFSFVVTLTLTLIQLFLEYGRGVSGIESRLGDISRSSLASLGEGLWRLDREQLRLQVDGILRLSDIRAVEVREITQRSTPMVVTAGRRADRSVIVRDYPILYRVQGTDRLIGVLRVEATLTELYRELMNTALVILISQAAKTFLISLFILYVFHRLVTRHLAFMARFVGSYDVRHPPPPFHLPRPRGETADELDQVVSAFNAMCAGLQRAYRDLREREARIRRLVESNVIGIVFWDLDGNITAANDAFLKMVGYSRQDLLSGKIRWTDITPAEFREADERAIAEIRAAGSCRPFEKDYVRKDGNRVPVLLGCALFEGSRDEGVAFVLDLTERRQAEMRQKLLLNELNHRVKNTLATVQAIAAQTLRTAVSPEAFRTDFTARLLALSQTHNLLTRSNWEGVSLRDVLRQELSPYDDRRVVLTGPEVSLGPVAAVTLGMAFHELTTNAAKFGALSQPAGQVRVAWEIDPHNRLHLDWSEAGGPPVAAPRRRGFGARLIERGLALEAGEAHLAFPPNGVHCTINMPLDRVTRH